MVGEVLKEFWVVVRWKVITVSETEAENMTIYITQYSGIQTVTQKHH